MKIAVNTRLLLRDRLDGIGWFTFEVFKRIVAAHPEVEFHFIFDRPYSPEFIFGKNVKAHVIPPPARHPMLMKIWYDWSLPALLKRIKPDIFISPDAQISLTSSIKQLVVIHDINFEHFPQDIPKVYTDFLKKRSPRFAQKAARIATVSEFSKSDLVRTYDISPDKIDVVYNGANTDYKPLSEKDRIQAKQEFAQGEDYFIFVGSIHPRKNLQRLIPAFLAYKKRTNSSVKLVLVGNIFWQDDQLKESMAEGIASGSILLKGRLGARDLTRAIGGALASVYVSYFEGFGIPIVEAFYAGVPVITSNVTSMPEVAGDAALLVDPFSIDEISNALEKIATDVTLRTSLVEKGFNRAKLFHWDKSAEAMWNCITKALQK